MLGVKVNKGRLSQIKICSSIIEITDRQKVDKINRWNLINLQIVKYNLEGTVALSLRKNLYHLLDSINLVI